MSVRKAYVAPIIEYGIVDIAVDVMAVVVLRGYLVADDADLSVSPYDLQSMAAGRGSMDGFGSGRRWRPKARGRVNKDLLYGQFRKVRKGFRIAKIYTVVQ